jgi:hypothetical protein
MTSNCPLLTVILKRKIALIISQQIGNNPYRAPCAVDNKAKFKGMPYTTRAIRIAITVANIIALWPFIFFIISAQNIKIMGTIATRADKAILLSGLTTCVQVIKFIYL